ncbi:MAG: MerR family transcriptional regulator [Acidimicrobiales bacterium]
MTIGRFARMSGLSVHALRYHDDVGNLLPTKATGTRQHGVPRGPSPSAGAHRSGTDGAIARRRGLLAPCRARVMSLISISASPRDARRASVIQQSW